MPMLKMFWMRTMSVQGKTAKMSALNPSRIHTVNGWGGRLVKS